MKIQAIRRFRKKDRLYESGEVFEQNEAYAKYLINCGLVRLFIEKQEKQEIETKEHKHKAKKTK